MLDDFFSGKKIFITGHTGFIGSWLTKWLTMLNAEVCGYSLGPPTKPNMYETLDLDGKIVDLRGDVRNRKALKEALKSFNPEIIFHLAAQPIVLESYTNPTETFKTNITGTVNILDGLRDTRSTRVIIVMTSDKVYKNNERIYPYKEIDPLGGKDPYSASKSCQDIIVNSFRESYFNNMGTSVSSIRAGNVIGGGDWGKYRIVPDIVKSLSKNNVIEIRNPNSVRPWQFVLEPIYGVLRLAEKMWHDIKFSGDWNFGPKLQQEIPVRKLVEEFIKNWGGGNFSVINNSSTMEAKYLKLDINKAIEELKWIPQYDFITVIKKTVDWYKKYYYDMSKIDLLTETQINEYFSGISK
ncbi:MAG: CDP-glucose 4,6-dehydratase [Nitrososphaerota archaeon]|jgi:CDP-glucose 4,6-dehydratase|nr:CDP-glucose 4,6-dehydratase [Nitrososphaerota archaeon]MDG7040087.1 CDP-glucose 4,6-dehydratase [Nitrososphaerota archaeon]